MKHWVESWKCKVDIRYSKAKDMERNSSIGPGCHAEPEARLGEMLATTPLPDINARCPTIREIKEEIKEGTVTP